MKESNICVYRHRKLSNREVFYIGIGNTKRPYNEINRSNFWKKTVEKHGYTVEVLATNLSREDACDLEVLLIQEYGRRTLGTGPLINLTEGGEGASGYRHTAENLKEMSVRMLGKTAHNKGIKMSEEQRLNLVEIYKNTDNTKMLNAAIEVLGKKVIDTSTNIVYPSISQAANALGLDRKATSKKLLGERFNDTPLRYAKI